MCPCHFVILHKLVLLFFNLVKREPPVPVCCSCFCFHVFSFCCCISSCFTVRLPLQHSHCCVLESDIPVFLFLTNRGLVGDLALAVVVEVMAQPNPVLLALPEGLCSFLARLLFYECIRGSLWIVALIQLPFFFIPSSPGFCKQSF